MKDSSAGRPMASSFSFCGTAPGGINFSYVSHTDALLITTAQGLTLVHFSAQLEPCLTHKYTLHTPQTPPYTP